MYKKLYIDSTIISTKLYVPVATLPLNDNVKFLENIKQGLKRTISWNEYRSKMNIKRLFVLSF